MQEKKPASYRKDLRVPADLWLQIKDLPNVSQFIFDACREKLARDKADQGKPSA